LAHKPEEPGKKPEKEDEEEIPFPDLVEADDDPPQPPPPQRLGWDWRPPEPEGIPHKGKD